MSTRVIEAEVLIEDAAWAESYIEMCKSAINTSLDHLGITASEISICVLLADNDRIAGLNGDFRGKPNPTNVLSWPAEELGAVDEGGQPKPTTPHPDGSLELGDIALAYGVCEQEAVDQGKLIEDHVTHLVVHGLLHVLGYDHIREGDAALMENTETAILAKLGIDDPYRIID